MSLDNAESFNDYFMDFKLQYRKKMFSSIEPDMELAKSAKEQPDIKGGAKRVIWR